MKTRQYTRRDISGMVFGRWTVTRIFRISKSGNSIWECVCVCGTKKNIVGSHLITGQSKSCGCLMAELVSKRNIKHGASKRGRTTTEYYSWNGLKRRCLDKTDENFSRYGGRGIRVCERWVHSFENFIEDMGIKPSPNHTIDRIDNNGNYEPSNCRWATSKQQANNRRNQVVLNFNGKAMGLYGWSEELGIRYATLWKRMNDGLPIEKILTSVKRKWGGV